MFLRETTEVKNDNKRVVVFDDVFFSLGQSGIARVWKSVFSLPSFKEELTAANIELIILNRSGVLTDVGYRTIDFPKYDPLNAATDRLLLDSMVEQHKAQLFISSYYTRPTNCNSIFVIYDLIPEKFGFATINELWRERTLGLVSSESFFAISESTKSDLLALYPWITAERVAVAHPGVDQSITKVDRQNRPFSTAHKLNDFAIWVGSREANYKNSEIIFKAMEKQKINLDFVFVGGDPLNTRELKSAARHNHNVLQLKLGDEELFQAFAEASVLLYPSLYEGFGLPPLEALALGTAVITTASSSLPEATGSLSIVISGTNADELTSAIAKATAPEHRSKIETLGPAWSKKFPWSNFASALVLNICQELQREKIDDAQVLPILRDFSYWKSQV